MRAEDARRIGLGLADRSRMLEQRAETAAFNPGIGTEQILTEEIEEYPPGRRLGEGDAALVPGRSPGILGKVHIVEQRFVEGRQDVALISLDRRHDATGDEGN